ncbi:MAG: hypothetical protein HY303_06780 [Candidatus Wallbacteria bacterium]|nr:hypothetical protein [Candidatus Wallbacteria bacterium]
MNLLKISLTVTLVFGFVFTSNVPAAALTDTQRTYIDRYLVGHGLNQYGDPNGTVYLGGNPLFDEATGTSMNRHDYILRKIPRILDGFVTILPWDGAGRAVGANGAGSHVRNDCDPRRIEDRFIDATVKSEERCKQLVERIRAGLDSHDFKSVHEILAQLAAMPREQLQELTLVLKDARRMLNAEFIQELDLTTQVRALLIDLDKLEARLAA